MNELIKQIHKQITSPRSSESRTRKLFRSQVIDGALEDTCKRSVWKRESASLFFSAAADLTQGIVG